MRTNEQAVIRGGPPVPGGNKKAVASFESHGPIAVRPPVA
jgi:hypothetical protein